MSFSKQIYEDLARAINAERIDALENFSAVEGLAADATVFNTTRAVANVLADHNPRFNHARFMKACGYPEDRV